MIFIWCSLKAVFPSYPHQVQARWSEKRAIAREILGESTLVREMCPDLGRDRSSLNLMLFEGRLGHRGPLKSSKIWDFDFSEEIDEGAFRVEIIDFLREFRSLAPELARYFHSAQIRIRYDLHSTFGLWIETKNSELEAFSQSALFGQLRKEHIVEVGQKNLGLERTAHCWLPSFSRDNKEIPLFSYVSSFTQPGPNANRALIASGLELLDDLTPHYWAEVGAGYGNLTAAYTSHLSSPVWILEKEAREVELLGRNKKEFPMSEIISGAAESIGGKDSLDLLVADPPRSGFAEFFKNDTVPARFILLYSCDLKRLLADRDALLPRYRLKKWSLVDLFPGTPYAEAISLWERSQ